MAGLCVREQDLGGQVCVWKTRTCPLLSPVPWPVAFPGSIRQDLRKAGGRKELLPVPNTGTTQSSEISVLHPVPELLVEPWAETWSLWCKI